MKYDKFFTLASERGISDAQLIINTHYSFEVSLFDGQMRNYQISDGSDVVVKGIYEGKLGVVSLDKFDNSKIDKVIEDIIESARIIKNDDPVFIYQGSEKYHKFNVFNPKLEEIPTEKKINLLYELHKEIKTLDSRVDQVQLDYEEVKESYTIINSKGLKLSQKSNYYVLSSDVVVRDNNVTKDGSEYVISNNFDDIDIKKFASDSVKKGIDKLGGVTCPTKTYKAILDREVVAVLLRYYISHASSESVQKGTSMWIDKVGQQVGSSKLTVIDKPIVKNPWGRYFDDEGVACYNKPIIKYGILQGYEYNLTTAAKDGVDSTGNGFGGGKVGVGNAFISLKPGKKSLNELIAKMGSGVYITDIEGMQGINGQNGNFSLQSTGFIIEDGKISKPLDLVTISGNLFEIFKDITDVGSDIRTTFYDNEVPSLLIKKLKVSSE